MYRTTTALALSMAALAPIAADANPVTIDVTIAQYQGPAVYLAMYLTDKSGAYQSTVWVAGGSTRYWKHLRTWFDATGGQGADGVTGASVGAGRTLTITPDGKTMFCNVQHPGEDGTIAAPTSHWPDSQTNPASTKRPRSATMVITRTDGGEVGV